MEYLEKFVAGANTIIWSNALIFLLMAVGIYFSLRMRFFQVRMIGDMIRLMVGGRRSKEGISPFQALAVSLSGRVGTGNIAGVATAIFLGGPGAVFWMWMVAFLGASSAFIESTLAQIYKKNINGQYRGGPAYYIQSGFKNKIVGRIYAIVFAISTILATGFLLPSVQSNSIAAAINNAFDLDHMWTAVLLVAILGLIIFGGIRVIARVAEYVVPFMAIGYVLLALVVTIINFDQIPEVFKLIFSSALGADATFGGIIGSAIVMGVKRGIFSNEAGQGTGPHPAAAAEASHPANQGLVQAFSVYIDTLFICTATAFMILSTGMYNVKGTGDDLLTDHGIYYIQDGIKHVDGSAIYTQAAVDKAFSGKKEFDADFHGVGSYTVAIALFFFAFTTLMAYYYIAETNVAFLTRKRGGPLLMFILKAGLLTSVFLGCVKTAKLAWDLGDLGVGLMAWLNIIAILILQKPALRTFKDYERQRNVKGESVFDAEKLGIENADFWQHKLRKQKDKARLS